MKGRLYGVGVGPGDPELITVKAAKLIKRADVVAYHSGTAGRSIARSIVADLISEDATEELLIYPVTTGDANHPLGYYGVIADFYDESAERLGKHLDAGRTVVVLAEGDPLFYSSYMYLHDRLAGQFRCEVVPGVTSMTAAAAAAGIPLARHEDVLTVLPGTSADTRAGSPAHRDRRRGDHEAGPDLRRSPGGAPPGWAAGVGTLRRAGDDRRRGHPAGRRGGSALGPLLLDDRRPRRRPTPGLRRTACRPPVAAGRRAHPPGIHRGSRQLLVVGLGPGPTAWLTPEVSTALAEVDHVVGYGPYIDRIPARPGLRRHASGNTVELDRARFALDLARNGERVAVVSGGDARGLRHGVRRVRGGGR